MPSAERWREITEVLNDALERPPAERAAFLDEACAGDPALRREVDACLEAEAEAPAFLDGSAANLLATFREAFAAFEERAAPASRLASGQRVGPYRLTGQIGRGGMSTIYRAERADGQFERTVAVKVLRRAVGSETDLRRRFEAERQILASLSHPYVAQVFDGGVTDSGRPYLVLEHVEGRPITTYCEEEELALDERLALFADVVEAVQHAHQNMIVHRDLKPSNILVTPEGKPKLLDFGIAKLLETAVGSKASLRTHTGALLMTPAYAAPEQVQGGDVTTATDVYALGVLLYELVAGQRPYQIEERTPLEIARVVCEETPPPPSAAVREREGDAPEQEPLLPSKRLRGDLDAIIMKALRKESDRRYGTAAALLEDVERHQEGRPVTARTGTWTYRAGKFVRRYRAGVATGAALVLLTTIFIAAMGWQMQQTAGQRDRAQAEAAKAEAAVTFLADLFQENNPLTDTDTPGTDASGRVPDLQDVFVRGAERVRTELDSQPVVQARLMSIIGGVYDDLGQYEEGESLLRRAVRQQRAHLGDTHPDLAASLHRLGYLHYDKGAFDDAVAKLREASAMYRALGSAYIEELSNVLNSLAQVRVDQGQMAEAVRLYRRVIAMRRDAGLKVLAGPLHNLAIALRGQGAFDEAVPLHKEAITRFTEQYGAMHPSIANAKAMYAFTLQQKGDLAAAESLHWEALEMRRKLLPARHPHTASSLVRLSMVLVKRGQPAEAETLAREGYAILREKLPATHWRVAAAKGVLAVTWAGQGQYRRAEGPLVESFEVFRRDFGLRDWRTRQTLQILVQLYGFLEQPEQAASYRALLEKARS